MDVQVKGSTPVPNPYATVQKLERRDCLLTEQPFFTCAKFTGEHIKNLSEAYKLLTYKAPRPGDWVEAMVTGLFVLAAPTIGTYLVVRSLPRAVVGGLGTAALAPLYTIEWLGHQVKNLTKSLQSSESQRKEQLEHLMGQFVNRMKERMFKGTPQEAIFFKQHPDLLINVSVVSVAFMSRREPIGLKVGNGLLTMEQIGGQDVNRKQYIQDVIAIKEAISQLPLSDDEDEAWNQLKEMSNCKLDTSNFPTEEGWEMVPDQKEYIQLAERQNPTINPHIIHILVIGYLLARDITHDPVFQRLWEKSL